MLKAEQGITVARVCSETCEVRKTTVAKR